MHAWLAVALVTAAAWPAARAARVTNQQVLLFEFSHDECVAGLFTDSDTGLVGDLKRHSAATCLDGLGVKSALSDPGTIPVDSTRNATDLNAKFGKQGFTIELWIQPSSDVLSASATSPIVTIGSNETTYDSDCIYLYNLALEQKQHKFNLDARYDHACKEETTFDVLSSGAASNQTHIAVVVNETSVFYYVNGGLAYSSGIYTAGWADNDMSYWGNDFFLQLFSNRFASVSPWTGSIFMLAVYQRALDADEVLQNFEAKLPNSPPVVYDMDVTIQEDGEVGSHYSDPSFYSDEVPVLQLANISLDAVDVDDDVGYVNYAASNNVMRVYIRSLPPASLASLYQITGEEITAANTEVLRIGGEYAVRVRPARDEYSGNAVFTNFTFYAVDGVSGEQSTDVATVVVRVTPKNDPAVPGVANATVYAGKKTLVTLDGSAVEASDSVVRAYISRLPTSGALYFANTSEMGDTEIELTAGAVVELPHDSMNVGYKYTGRQDLDKDARGFIARDSFGFRLLDSSGEALEAMGTEGNFTLLVGVGIEACAIACDSSRTASAQRLLEDEAGTVTLFGKDYGDSPGHLQFRITSLPEHGTLTDPVTGATLAQGDLLSQVSNPAAYSEGVDVTFTPQADWFNYPSTMFNGSSLGRAYDKLAFRVESLNQTNTTSQATTVSVRIQNVNDAPTVVANVSNDLTVYAFGYSDDDTDEPKYPTTLDISGISLVDADHNTDVVVVEIAMKRGLLSLNPRYLELVDFTGSLYGACFEYGDWQCSGDGEADRTLRFVGQPKDVNLAMSLMEYKCTSSGVTDTITVTVYDGKGTPAGCMDADELDDANCCSDHSDGCLTSSASFTVTVGDYASVASAEEDECEGWCLDILTFMVLLGAAIGLAFLFCVQCKRLMSSALGLDNRDEFEDSEEEDEFEQLLEDPTSDKAKAARGSFLYQCLCCPFRCLHNLCCCCMCVWCFFTNCPSKKRSRKAKKLIKLIQAKLRGNDELRQRIEQEMMAKIPPLRWFWCLRCLVFRVMWCPFTGVVGKLLCCFMGIAMRVLLERLPLSTLELLAGVEPSAGKKRMEFEMGAVSSSQSPTSNEMMRDSEFGQLNPSFRNPSSAPVPDLEMQDEDPENDPETWEMYDAPNGKPYYYNTVTKKTVWDKPRFRKRRLK